MSRKIETVKVDQGPGYVPALFRVEEWGGILPHHFTLSVRVDNSDDGTGPKAKDLVAFLDVDSSDLRRLARALKRAAKHAAKVEKKEVAK